MRGLVRIGALLLLVVAAGAGRPGGASAQDAAAGANPIGSPAAINNPVTNEVALLAYRVSRDLPRFSPLADLTPGISRASEGDDDADDDRGPDEPRKWGRFATMARDRAGADDPDGSGAPSAVGIEPTAAACAWMTGTIGRLNALAPVGMELQGMDDEIDPARLREIAAVLAAAAEEQRASDPPAGADEANTEIADALDRYAAALAAVADAVAAGELPDTTALLADVQGANALIESAADVTGPLVEACALG